MQEPHEFIDEREGGLHIAITEGYWFPFGNMFRGMVEVYGEKTYLHPCSTLEECKKELVSVLDTMLEKSKKDVFSIETIKRKLEERNEQV